MIQVVKNVNKKIQEKPWKNTHISNSRPYLISKKQTNCTRLTHENTVSLFLFFIFWSPYDEHSLMLPNMNFFILSFPKYIFLRARNQHKKINKQPK